MTVWIIILSFLFITYLIAGITIQPNCIIAAILCFIPLIILIIIKVREYREYKIYDEQFIKKYYDQKRYSYISPQENHNSISSNEFDDKFKNKNQINEQFDLYPTEINIDKKYRKKKLLTNCELEYKKAIDKYLPAKYKLLPQICLASVVEKLDENKYANELFRIIDFGVFDCNYNLKLLIEINDNTHHNKYRIARDYKVKEICKEAEIPLIIFWTEFGIDEYYIQKRLDELLS